MKRFKCQKCGSCCKDLRGRLLEEDALRHLSRVDSYRQSGLYYLLDPSDFTVALFGWEKRRMEEEAKASEILLKVTPLAVVLDRSEENAIVLRWMLDHDICPFLSSKNECRIYSDRPLTCRSFPLFAVGKDLQLVGLEYCGGLKALALRGKKILRRRETLRTFKKPREYAIVEHSLNEVAFEILSRLQEKGSFLPALDLGTEYVRTITDAKSIDVFDFAVRRGLMTSEDLQKMSRMKIPQKNR